MVVKQRVRAMTFNVIRSYIRDNYNIGDTIKFNDVKYHFYKNDFDISDSIIRYTLDKLVLMKYLVQDVDSNNVFVLEQNLPINYSTFIFELKHFEYDERD